MQTLQGQVISTKIAKTATVEVRRRFMHPIYKKSVNLTKKYLVHDEKGVQVGDVVKFTPCKPISKLKRWKILEVIGVKMVEPVTEETQPKKVKKAAK